MATPADKYIGAFSSRWVDFSRRNALWVVLASAVVAALLFRYTVANLGINTDTADMISDKLPWRQHFIDYREAFPQFTNNMIVVIESGTPELLRDAHNRLTAALAADPSFGHVFSPGAGEFFERNGLLFLDLEDLEELADSLAEMQPFLGTLARNPTLTGFTGLFSRAVEATEQGQVVEFGPALSGFERAFDAARDDQYEPMSWQGLLASQRPDVDDTRRIILLKPRLDFDAFQPAHRAVGRVRDLAGELGLSDTSGVRVRLTGPVALQHEELSSVRKGATVAGLLALIMVSIILLVALRSWQLIVASVVTLIVGLIGTAAFAAAAVGDLNLISVAFAVLYIGLGIDFAIHFSLRYRELVLSGEDHASALRSAAGDVGASLVLCALTTSVGFFAFFPTEFVGVSELGLISGVGMYISLFTTITLLPAILTLVPLRTPRKPKPISDTRSIPSYRAHSRAIRIGALVVGIGSIALAPGLRFDSNPLNLRDPKAESVATFRDLLRDVRSSPLTLSVLAQDLNEARMLARRLGAADSVDRAMTLENFIPELQEDKLFVIEDMSLLVGADLAVVERAPRIPDPDEQLAAVDRLIASLDRLAIVSVPSDTDKVRALRSSAIEFRNFIGESPPETRAARLRLLERNLVGVLPLALDSLRLALEAQPLEMRDLPASLTERWRSADARYRVEVFPAEDLSEDQAQQRFVRQVREIVPATTGLPVVNVEAGGAVVRSFRQAIVTALVLILALLLVLLRNWRDPLLVITPVVLAALLTAAAAVLLRMPINFANIIALPLLLGVGVDNGIHIVHRYRSALPAGADLLHTSTARAVVFSGLTTIFSFGNLAISPHVGMASMGRLLTIGMVFTLFCTLVVLPAILDGGKKP